MFLGRKKELKKRSEKKFRRTILETVNGMILLPWRHVKVNPIQYMNYHSARTMRELPLVATLGKCIKSVREGNGKTQDAFYQPNRYHG